MKGSVRCGCGSGRLFKNCCKSRPPVALEIDLDAANVELDGIAFSGDGILSGVKSGQLRPLIGSNAVTYRNANSARKKILSVAPSYDTSIYLDPNASLASFPAILVVDTNTRSNLVERNKVSVSTLIHCITERIGERNIYLKYSLVGAWEFWNLKGNEEQYFWKALTESIETGSADEIYQAERVGILTDCNVGKHTDFNARRDPIYEDYYLPERFSLFYASSDSARDLPNKLVRKCDAFSANVMRTIGEEGTPPKLEGYPFTHFRKWMPTDDDTSWQIEGYERPLEDR